MDGAPWVSLPFDTKKDEIAKIEKVIPNIAFPTPGVVRADGTVVEADVFGKVNDTSLTLWLKK